MEGTLSAEVMNQLFINKLSEPGGKEKIAAAEQDIIRDRLREDSFIDKLIPQKSVQRQDLQVSLEGHDTLIKVEWVEPNSKATSMSTDFGVCSAQSCAMSSALPTLWPVSLSPPRLMGSQARRGRNNKIGVARMKSL